MDPTHSDRTAVLAYHRWEQAGRPEGRDLEFWLRAERELDPDALEPLVLADGSPVSNLDRVLPPDERRRMRERRHAHVDGGHAPRWDQPPRHFVVVLDRAHLRIYEVRSRDEVLAAQYELAEAFDFPAARRRYSDNDTDQAGRFPGTTGLAGGSIDERLPMANEHERRLLNDLANQLDQFLAEQPGATWDYAAGPGIHQPLLNHLTRDVRARLKRTLVKELVHQSPQELRGHFTATPARETGGKRNAGEATAR